MLGTYGSLLGPWALGPLRAAAGLTARELESGLVALRAQGAAGAAGRAPRLIPRLSPRLNPLNYRFELRGLGSNLGNVEVSYTGAEAAEEVAEHLQPPALTSPPLSDKVRSHLYYGDVNKGKSRGWHYEPTGDAAQGTYVVDSTRSALDANGVYEANVYIEGVKKRHSLRSFRSTGLKKR